MEKLLRKSSIYGFFIGIGLALFLVKYKDVIKYEGNVTETTYLPIAEYIITVLRFGVISSLIGLFIGWYIIHNAKK